MNTTSETSKTSLDVSSVAETRLAAVRRDGSARVRATCILALRMMIHDRAKFVGTTLGVVFAVVLGTQQIGTLMGLLQKNAMFVDNAGADLWIVPPNTTLAQPGQRLSEQLLFQARSTAGVEVASPVVMAGSSIVKPGGGSEAITIIGFDVATNLGGPWNIVAGKPEDLAHADTMFFEDAQRERFGGLNLGSVREVGGHAVRVGGFTFGLLPFGPAYSFAEIDLARDIADFPRDQLSFVLIKVAPGQNREAVQRRLGAKVPAAQVVTREEFHSTIVGTLLRQQLGITFGTTTAFALVIGFVIVALSMFSSVLDKLREFGTLKAMGMTNFDLTRMLIVQSIAYALLGSILGLGLVAGMAEGIRSANLSVIVPRNLIFATPFIMMVLCTFASVLALRRIRKLEPGMVFR